MLNVRADSAWRPVVGFEGLYEVSNFGNVRSVDRVVVCHDGVKYRRRGQVISQQVTPKGYRVVSLSGGRKFFVHRLVLEAFVGPRPEGCITLHADDNPGNNLLENLRWGTYADNKRDAARNRGLRAARWAAFRA